MVGEYYQYLREMKQYAETEKIPIMQEEGLDFLTTFIIKHQIRNILEIGTAIGYSTIMMALCHKEIRVTSIERDETRYLEALKNVKKFHLEDRITLIFNDALETKIEGTFDLIFIDAAKAQDIKFFQLFSKNLAEKGYIITDNMYFHGLVEKNEKEIKSHNLRGLVRKIKEYIAFLNNHPDFNTVIYRVGDGVAVSERKAL